MKKAVLVIVLFFLVGFNSFGQSPDCLNDIGYTQSLFQVESISANKYKTSLTTLGISYVNPCFFNSDHSSIQDTLILSARLGGREQIESYKCYLMKQKKGIVNVFSKWKRFVSVEELGIFSIDEDFALKLEKKQKYYLLFVNTKKEQDLIAVELKSSW